MPELSTTPNGHVTVTDLKKVLDSDHVLVLDVRERDEYRYEHIKKSMNTPLSQLNDVLQTLPKDKALYVICQTGVRTTTAVENLRASSFQEVHAVGGGIKAWKAAGFPLERAKGPIPIMRQVQIAAGSLAFLGGLIPGLRWVAIIVGLGLVFAGVSGTCGMALLLSRMPWNKHKASGQNPAGSCSSS